MPDKIIYQRAQGYGSEPVAVTVQIDGTTVLQGPVPTLDTPPPSLPDSWVPNLGVDAWSWTVPASFSGTQNMTVSVSNGQVYLCDTFYTLSDQPGNVYPLVFQQTQGNLQFNDPLTTVTIDTIPQNPVRDINHKGQWVWQLSAGNELACTVNIAP